MEAAIAMGQLERARQQLTWAWQVYGGVPALQVLAARLLEPPEAAARPTPAEELPTLPFVRQVDGRPAPVRPAVSAELPTVQLATQKMPRLTVQPPADPEPVASAPPPPRNPPAPPAGAILADHPTVAFPTLPLPRAPQAPAPAAEAGPPPLPPLPGGASPAQIEAWIQESQQLVRAANYDGALALLARALREAPHDENVQRHHQLTEKAVQRHRAALDREQAIGLAGREIAARLHVRRPAEARQALRDALLEHGRHPVFDELQARLEARLAEQKLVDADELLGEARFAFQNGDWQQAIAAAEECLALAPGQAEAAELRRQAQLQLAQLGRENAARSARRRGARRRAAARRQRAAAGQRQARPGGAAARPPPGVRRAAAEDRRGQIRAAVPAAPRLGGAPGARARVADPGLGAGLAGERFPEGDREARGGQEARARASRARKQAGGGPRPLRQAAGRAAQGAPS